MACENITICEHKYMSLLNKLYCFYESKLKIGTSFYLGRKKYYIHKRDALRVWIEVENKIEIMEISCLIDKLINYDSVVFC